ncbi:MAG TPA: CGNR zinc finger domain-containing protein [Gaiellaceae bacterium]
MTSLANYRSLSTPGGPILEFVDDPETVRDPGRLRELLQRFGPAPPHDPTAAELERLARLRETAVHLLEIAASGRLPSAGEVAELNAYLAAPVQVQLAPGDGGFVLETTPLSAGWDTVVRDLAGRVADLLARHDPRRLKRCANPDCGRFFYDESRNRTRRWHDDACGNLVRVRRFRAAR